MTNSFHSSNEDRLFKLNRNQVDNPITLSDMKKYGKATLMGACALLGLSAVSCTPGERGAVVGGAIGAGTGALIGDGTGALIGGAIGAAAGSEISKNRAHRNYYYGH